MPNKYTFPTLYNEVLQINISKLKEWGYLSPEQIKSGAIVWSRNGNRIGSISITVNTHSEQLYIVLDYKYKDKPRNYKIKLVSVPSNLGKGVLWYFLCPETNKRCRKLYSIGGYFLHREAFSGCMYECQTFSKKTRSIEKELRGYFSLDSCYEELNKKYFKKFYNGKPTKRYLKLLKSIEKGEGVPIDRVNSLMMG